MLLYGPAGSLFVQTRAHLPHLIPDFRISADSSLGSSFTYNILWFFYGQPADITRNFILLIIKHKIANWQIKQFNIYKVQVQLISYQLKAD